MTNEEVLQNYATEKWVIKELLCYCLQEYWQQANGRGEMPVNPVGFVGNWLKSDTIMNLEFAEKSKMRIVENNVVYDQQETPSDIKKVKVKRTGQILEVVSDEMNPQTKAITYWLEDSHFYREDEVELVKE